MLFLAALLFGLMAVIAKRASLHLPGPEVAFMRFVVGLVVIAIAGSTVVRMRRPVNVRSLVIRGIFGGLAVLLYFIAIAKLPVGTATLLNYTAPVFTAVDAAIFLGEAVSVGTIAALALTLGGVVLVVHGQAPPGAHLFGFGRWELCGLASAVCSGAAVTAIRAARRTDGTWEIFGFLCFFGLVSTAPMAIAGWVWPSAFEWGLLVAVGVVAAFAQVLYGQALRYVKAATAGVITQLTPITAMVLGVAFFGDTIGAKSLFGSALTLGGVSWAAWISANERARAEKEKAPVLDEGRAPAVQDASG